MMNDVHGHTESDGSRAAAPHEPLSPQGMQRKQHLLVELQAMVQRQGRRRRVMRTATPIFSAVAVVAIGAVAARYVGTREQTPTPADYDGRGLALVDPTSVSPLPVSPSYETVAPGHTAGGGAGLPHAGAYTSIRLVSASTTRRSIVREVGATGGVSVVRTINDDELIAVLAQTGRNCGIVRTASHARVMCNSCDPGDVLFGAPQQDSNNAPATPNTGTL